MDDNTIDSIANGVGGTLAILAVSAAFANFCGNLHDQGFTKVGMLKKATPAKVVTTLGTFEKDKQLVAVTKSGAAVRWKPGCSYVFDVAATTWGLAEPFSSPPQKMDYARFFPTQKCPTPPKIG